MTVEPPLVAGLNSPFGVRVAVEDANGNVVTSFNGPVDVYLNPPQSNPSQNTSNILSGGPFVYAVNGVADFPALSLNTVGSGYTLQATADDLTSTVTRPFTIAITPAQLRKAYGFDQIPFLTDPTDPNYYNEHAGAGQTIAIVIDGDDPHILNTNDPNYSSSDLALFDAEFGLPDPPSLIKVGQDINNPVGSLPTTGSSDFELEESMDVEWAHALAPQAMIVVVECTQYVTAGMLTAAEYPGVSVVSVSAGVPYDNEDYDINFINNTINSGFDNSDIITPANHRGVTFVASAGDIASGIYYPAISPNVVSVGGTVLSVGPDGSYSSELAWLSSGGGVASGLEDRPSYQVQVQNTGFRTVPDVAFDAHPSSSVAVYDSQYTFPFWIDNGTSLGAPCWAALIALADQLRVTTSHDPDNTLDGRSQTLPGLYNQIPSTDFHKNFFNETVASIYGMPNGTSLGGIYYYGIYNENTGLGTPRANLIVPALAMLPVVPVSLSPSTPSLSSGTLGTAYTQTIIASGGILNKSLTYRITSGTQPADLGLTLTGSANQLTISGTPTAAGTLSFDVFAIDSAGDSTSLNYTLTINPMNVTAQIRASQSRLIYSRRGKLVTGTIRITNAGTTALSGLLEIVLGGLPPGVSLANGSGHTGGGNPYISLNLANKPLRPRQSFKVRLHFAERNKHLFKYQVTFFQA